MEIITYEESTKLDNVQYIDVRSPAEFEDDHIPGAVNIPIFDNEERKEVGTLYKLAGKNEAILKGTEYVGAKLPKIVEDILKFKDQKIVVYCARGGMRSGSVVSLMTSLGIKTKRIEKGYKGFRKYVSEQLETITIKPKIIILQGMTGTGKTEVIQYIQNSIDLEGMAGHRSSLFGAIGLKQFSQKNFETKLLFKINELKEEKYIIIEGESRRIGNLQIPSNIFKQMRAANAILLTASIERRVEITLKEYTKNLDINEAIKIVSSLRKRLGKTVDTLLDLLKNNDLEEFTTILLNNYYDPLYGHTLGKLNYLYEIENTDSKKVATEIREKLSK